MIAQCGHISRPSLDPKVPNKRYGYRLSIGTSGWVTVIWQSEVVFLCFHDSSGAGNLHSNPDFQIHTIQRWSHLNTWNQSLVILNIPNFNPMKEALSHSHPILRYSIFRDGLRLYLRKKEWYVHIVRGPCPILSNIGDLSASMRDLNGKHLEKVYI